MTTLLKTRAVNWEVMGTRVTGEFDITGRWPVISTSAPLLALRQPTKRSVPRAISLKIWKRWVSVSSWWGWIQLCRYPAQSLKRLSFCWDRSSSSSHHNAWVADCRSMAGGPILIPWRG